MTNAAAGASTVTGTQLYRVYIKATPAAVWDAVTRPEWTRRFGYGGDITYELRPGGRYLGLATPEMRQMGVPEVMVDGEVIEVDPPRRLVQTWRLVMDPDSAAEGFTRLTYEISDRGEGVTRLTITHDLEHAPRVAHVVSGGLDDEGHGGGGGWAWVLSSLKTLLETGETMPWT